MGGLFDLNGKVAIVTGSSRGIGKAVAHRLAEQGASVAISSRNQAECDAAAAEIDGLVGRKATVARAADLESRASLQALVDAAIDAFGKVDILICNGATNQHSGAMQSLPDDALTRTLTANLYSSNWLAQMVAPGMRQRGDGAIVLTSSIGAMRANSDTGAYAISKAADLALMRQLALELGPDGIRVNAVLPGLVRTQLSQRMWENQAAEDAYVARLKIKRLGEPDDLAGIFVYLASPAGAWTTGQSFIIDGGALS